MNVIVAGQKHFAHEVAEMIARRPGWQIVGVSCPVGGDRPDRLAEFAQNRGIPVIPSGSFTAAAARAVAPDLDLIVCAHCHDFIGERLRSTARLGALGYHPSLLPLHRGRSAIEWAIRMRERVTGGTVYWMDDVADGGPIAAQRHVFIRPDDDAATLWRRDLAPLGLELLGEVFDQLDAGTLAAIPQSAELATWEPSVEMISRMKCRELASAFGSKQSPGSWAEDGNPR
ncbi:formyltransferase family protein [Haloferula sargassicola]|uniref:Methionyl-tRNA formyltransferase n=1 Tax=Haloferula sargassicola TaxID=490096 RepID=A0ABP9UQK5_9BACT